MTQDHTGVKIRKHENQAAEGRTCPLTFNTHVLLVAQQTPRPCPPVLLVLLVLLVPLLITLLYLPCVSSVCVLTLLLLLVAYPLSLCFLIAALV